MRVRWTVKPSDVSDDDRGTMEEEDGAGRRGCCCRSVTTTEARWRRWRRRETWSPPPAADEEATKVARPKPYWRTKVLVRWTVTPSDVSSDDRGLGEEDGGTGRCGRCC